MTKLLGVYLCQHVITACFVPTLLCPNPHLAREHSLLRCKLTGPSIIIICLCARFKAAFLKRSEKQKK